MGREEGSGWGTHVYLWWIHVNTWQNQYNIVKLKKKMLSRLVIAFPPKSKCLLISWLQSLSAAILEPPKIKFLTVSMFPHLFAMK